MKRFPLGLAYCNASQDRYVEMQYPLRNPALTNTFLVSCSAPERGALGTQSFNPSILNVSILSKPYMLG